MANDCELEKIPNTKQCPAGVCLGVSLGCKGVKLLDYVGASLNRSPVVNPFPDGSQAINPTVPTPKESFSGGVTQGLAADKVTWPEFPR